MNDNDLEELRYNVAHHMLSEMSKGSQFQYALDRMMDLMDKHTEEELLGMLPKKKRPKKKKSKGGGF